MAQDKHYSIRKKKSETFFGISIDEGGLYQISNKIVSLADEYKEYIQISLHTSDGEDVYKITDPSFFLGDDLPKRVRKVLFYLSSYRSPISCDIVFDATRNGEVKLFVEGNDLKTVTTLFYELRRLILDHQYSGAIFVKFISRLGVKVITYLVIILPLCILFVRQIARFILHLLISINPSIPNLPNYDQIRIIFGAIAIGGGGTALSGYGDRIYDYLPPVIFTGKLSDPNSRNRKIIWWLFSAVILQIAIAVALHYWL